MSKESKSIEMEWYDLIVEAKQIGITREEVQSFLDNHNKNQSFKKTSTKEDITVYSFDKRK